MHSPANEPTNNKNLGKNEKEKRECEKNWTNQQFMKTNRGDSAGELCTANSIIFHVFDWDCDCVCSRSVTCVMYIFFCNLIGDKAKFYNNTNNKRRIHFDSDERAVLRVQMLF